MAEKNHQHNIKSSGGKKLKKIYYFNNVLAQNLSKNVVAELGSLCNRNWYFLNEYSRIFCRSKHKENVNNSLSVFNFFCFVGLV